MTESEPPAFARASPRHPGLPDVVMLGEARPGTRLVARARLLGARIDTRAILEDPAIAVLAPEAGLTFVFRYGVAVSFGAGTEPTEPLDARLQSRVVEPVTQSETETADLEIRPDRTDRIGSDGQIQLADASQERLLLAAIVLSRSVVLSRDEMLVSEAFNRTGPLVNDLRQNGRARLPITPVKQMVGEVLSARHRVMGTVQVDERPDILWDHPGLDRLYARLEAEYELKERAEVLERKFAALGDFAEVLLDIVQDKRAFRLELAIMALIAFEIVLSLFNVAVK